MRTPRPSARAALAVLLAAGLGLAPLSTALAAPESPDRDQRQSTAVGPTAIAPTPAGAVAEALSDPGLSVTGATYLTAPPDGGSAGVADSAVAGFPTAGPTFGVLSSGTVSTIEAPGTFSSTSLGGENVRGNTDLDVTVLQVDLTVPTGANCLSFDFRFLSEEYPVFVGSTVNDGFVAELDSSTWTTEDNTILAPDNFAFDGDGNVVSINSTGVGGMSAAAGAGTAFDGAFDETGLIDTNGGATSRLAASTPITPGAHSVFLSIFDQGDRIYDSAVFVDNMRVGYTPDPDLNCVPGAIVVTHDLDLEPETGTGPVGTEHTVTATLTTDDGAPVTDATVTFEVSGPNAGSGSAVTDDMGVATYSYTGTAAGTDTIAGCFTLPDETACAATDSVTFTWVQDDEKQVERWAGPDRYGTAADIAEQWAPGVDLVYVATGVDYPDALPAGALAGLQDAPMLLVRQDSIPAVTAAALDRLDPARIVILGGTPTISAGVEAALADFATADTPDEVSRLAGADRYATAREVAAEFGTDVPVVYVAKATDFPDALAGAARTGLEGGPVLLTKTDALPSATRAALTAADPARIVVLGDEESVSGPVATALADYTDGAVTRHAGDDRYHTAALVAADYDSPANAVFIATGDRFPDALTVGPAAVGLESPVLLTKLDSLPASTVAELERLNPARIVVLGDENSVSEEVETALAAYLD